jgi:hypothetical protein
MKLIKNKYLQNLIQMTYRNFLTLALITFFTVSFGFISCEKDEVETLPLQTVNGEVLEAVDYGAKVFVFKFNTDLETYPITYQIRNELSVDGNLIDIHLKDIERDGNDDLNIAKGPASCTINLGALGKGQYDVNILVGQSANQGTITIDDDQILLDFPTGQGLTINHDTLNRIPFGTIWGYVGYQNSSNQGLANNFITGMNALGAEPATLQPGYYGYFSISDSGDIVQPIDPNHTYYKEFIKDYQGDAAALDEHIGYYNTEYYNKVDVVVYWFWDGTWKSALKP